jgi:hypothetical protein
MKPTSKLRFVKRVVPAPQYGEGVGVTANILQQWWEDPSVVLAVLRFGPNGAPINEHPGEWRDIPIEEESK